MRSPTEPMCTMRPRAVRSSGRNAKIANERIRHSASVQQ
jgi:hypothetical protein